MATTPIHLPSKAGLAQAGLLSLRNSGLLPALERHERLILPFAIVFVVAWGWLWFVSKTVPEPYLDEVFHIPQAQQYCRGNWSYWDDKITTPPGLYAVSVAALRLGLLESSTCSTLDLRSINVWAVAVVAALATLCRHSIEQAANGKGGSRRNGARNEGERAISWHVVHTGVNVALFPVLFFFSGLYYTDIVSVLIVLAAYSHHLGRVQTADVPSWGSDCGIIILGVASLFMRQTNVFWTVVYMGGLEVVHAVKILTPSTSTPAGLSLRTFTAVRIYDPSLADAWIDDVFLVLSSLAVCILANLPRILRRVWPYLVVLVLFAVFVAWNGGVVLGDKSNHVATVHLAQILYLWPLLVFFSFPHAVPRVLALVYRFHGQSNIASNQRVAPRHRALCVLRSRTFLALVGVVAAGAIVHYNTIVHPFTLADNRHYMFYVFRYTIRRPGVVRYALVVPYIACCWLVWVCFCPGFVPARLEAAKSATEKLSTAVDATTASPEFLPATDASAIAVSVSTAVLLFVSTALSLITAPLVEPRYFILPWVLWRLLLPSWRAPAPSSRDDSAAVAAIDPWLSLETLWHVVVNMGTMYLFLTRPFQWWNPDGSVADGGRWQRFMW